MYLVLSNNISLIINELTLSEINYENLFGLSPYFLRYQL